MNNVQLVGNICRDPELRQNGDRSVTRFTIACQRTYKNAEGKYESDFISCVSFGKTAEFISKYFAKGNKIGIIGEIRTGSYTKEDGTKVYTTDVVANSAEFVQP